MVFQTSAKGHGIRTRIVSFPFRHDSLLVAVYTRFGDQAAEKCHWCFNERPGANLRHLGLAGPWAIT